MYRINFCATEMNQNIAPALPESSVGVQTLAKTTTSLTSQQNYSINKQHTCILVRKLWDSHCVTYSQKNSPITEQTEKATLSRKNYVFRRLVSRYMMDRTVPSSATFSGLLIETNYFLCFQVKAFMNDLVCSISSRMCTYYKIKFG